jgi:hypothetical protein
VVLAGLERVPERGCPGREGYFENEGLCPCRCMLCGDCAVYINFLGAYFILPSLLLGENKILIGRIAADANEQKIT